ncbi:uncharacterized protein LOC135931557 [Gordionus sp. m RMFG-2023]|uniref:uncharacterized protein LOC135931557 n=1 Tax=Gordionus sp. m RMFG-2023 TaxID=3053472 RepID=UPI0031FDB6EF
MNNYGFAESLIDFNENIHIFEEPTFIDSQKGKSLLFFLNFLYRYNGTYRNTIYYRCLKADCKVTCKYIQGYTISKMHEHQNHAILFHKLKTLQTVKATVQQNPLDTRMNIYLKALNQQCSEDPDIINYPGALPPFISFKNTINRILKQTRPNIPISNDTIVLTTELITTFSGDSFLIKNNKLIVFGFVMLVSLSSYTKFIYMDGTFYTCPRFFSQLYTIHIMYNQTMIPIIYALLPDKRKESYIELFQIIVEYGTLNGIQFSPDMAQTDYEAGAISALQFVFPNILVKGCFVHFTQAIWRKVQHLGLVKQYKEETAVYTIVRRMSVLPLCKREDIQVVCDSCVDLAANDPLILSFLIYMDTTWINSDAIFPHQIWTRYKIQGPRSNNHLEGYHHSLKRMAKNAHPDIYSLIRVLKDNQRLTELKVIQINNGEIVTGKNKKYVMIN